MQNYVSNNEEIGQAWNKEFMGSKCVQLSFVDFNFQQVGYFVVSRLNFIRFTQFLEGVNVNYAY